MVSKAPCPLPLVCISRVLWAGPTEAPLGAEAEGKQPLLCRPSLDPEVFLSHPAFGRRARSAREAPPQPRPGTPPSFLSTIHLRLPRARNVARDTVGLVPNPLLAHFTRAFTNWPPSRGCRLGFGSKGADGGPSSPQSLMLCFAPTPQRRLHHGRSRNPGVGAGSLRPQLYADTQHYGEVCLC